MAYSLTGAMFLVSYLFPFSVTVSSLDSGSKVIFPNNGVVNVTSGTNVRIPCVFDDRKSSVHRGQWNKNFRAILKMENGKILLNRDYQAITRSGTFDLVIRDIQARDKGVFQCIGATAEGKVRYSKTLNLNVIEGDASPSSAEGRVQIITPKNNEMVVESGAKLVIRCPVTGQTNLKRAIWQKDLSQIGEMRNGRATFNRYYRTSSVKPGAFNLIIPSVRTRDKGIYQCVGYDRHDKLLVGETLTLRVNSPGGSIDYPPFPPPRRRNKNTFVFIPDNSLKDVPIGKTVVIRCPLVRNESDVQNATWEKNWLKIGTLANGKAVFDPPRPAVNISVPVGIFDIVITNVRIRDEGTYQCINLFAEGEKFSNTLKLRVPIASERPRLYQVLSGLSYPVDRVRKVMVPTGRSFKLKCEAKRGHPGADLVWRVGGALIVSNHTGPFRVREIFGQISHTSIVEGKKKPPLYRSTESLLDVVLPPKYNNSLIMCMAVNPGASKMRSLTRVVMVESGNDPNGRPALVVNSFALTVLMFFACRLVV